jgi:peroxygenase
MVAPHTECLIHSNPLAAAGDPPVDLSEPIPAAGEARHPTAPDREAGSPVAAGPAAPVRSVMQQHVDFFDRSGTGIITVGDTYAGFRAIGFSLLYAVLAVIVIHPIISLQTNGSALPFDPQMRIWTKNIKHAKHGSDSGAFDAEGRFVPQKFEEVFSKWDLDRDDKLGHGDLLRMMRDLRATMDVLGWIAAFFEWSSVWLLCRDKDGLVGREDVRGVLDGTLFPKLAAKKSA